MNWAKATGFGWVTLGVVWTLIFFRALIWSLQEYEIELSLLWAGTVLWGVAVMISGWLLAKGKKKAHTILSILAIPALVYCAAYFMMVRATYGLLPLVGISSAGIISIFTIFSYFFLKDRGR